MSGHEWLKLYIGNQFTGIMVCRDCKYPTMWRVRWADGQLSDMVNLARAKDAALVLATRERGKGLNKYEVASWRPVAKPPGTSYSDFSGKGRGVAHAL